MTDNIIESSIDYVNDRFSQELSEGFSFHNFEHTMKVVGAVKKLSAEAGLSEEDTEILELAAIFHDIGFIIDPENHENHSSAIAKEFLEKSGYENDKIQSVSKIILSTRIDIPANTDLEKYIKDADLSGLADDDYLKVCEKLRKEIVFRNGTGINKEKWNKENIEFFQNHYYCTDVGKKLFTEGKDKNLELLKQMDETKKKKKGPKLLTIGSSKSAQTQLKTALRNHIDLSSIADNKANIMLSVNAIVITVGLPIILDKLATNNNLIIPTIILALASLGSMVFATLSTRPAKMFGVTNMEQITNKKSNLFFFGNYYNMSFDEYEEGMRAVVSNNEILDNSITRDLYFLGKSLGNKFEYLRWCYNIFMYGIIAAIVSYIIIHVISSV